MRKNEQGVNRFRFNKVLVRVVRILSLIGSVFGIFGSSLFIGVFDLFLVSPDV